jgi:hypothetical protein
MPNAFAHSAMRFGFVCALVAVLALAACSGPAPVEELAEGEIAEPTACELARARTETDNYTISGFAPQEAGNDLQRSAEIMDYARPCAVLATEKDEQLRDLVRAYLDLNQSGFGGAMVRTLDFEDGAAALRAQESQVFERQLKAGTRYRFIGACDNECHDIDLFLIDSAGAMLEADRALDHFPVLNFMPETDGLYRIVLQMYNCDVEPCYVGMRVLELRASWALNPRYGAHQLVSGFTPDPWSINVQSGGDIDMRQRQSSCAGFITENPDVRIMFEAGEAGLPLIVSVNSPEDTTLVINGADGIWRCDDDGGVLGANPMVVFDAPPSGQYDIWVGTYAAANTYYPATLSVSEQASH